MCIIRYSERTLCEDNPCAHNQTCVNRNIIPKHGYAFTCECSKYFSGLTCKS